MAIAAHVARTSNERKVGRVQHRRILQDHRLFSQDRPFYHEKGVLIPRLVDENTGYRYYDHAGVEKARVVARLRKMEFSLVDIKEMFDRCDDDSDVLDYLERQRTAIADRIRHDRNVVASLDEIIRLEREALTAMKDATFEVEQKVLDVMLIAGIRYRGKYCECGQAFAKIGRALGRYAEGKPFCLYYDGEYKEDDADIEACMPLRKRAEAEGILVRELPGGRCVALLHRGPYAELGCSYAKILEYVKSKRLRTILPSREVYLKGPGMIFRGNPKRYLTEIQLLIEE